MNTILNARYNAGKLEQLCQHVCQVGGSIEYDWFHNLIINKYKIIQKQ
jgi:hypothetical protein